MDVGQKTRGLLRSRGSQWRDPLFLGTMSIDLGNTVYKVASVSTISYHPSGGYVNMVPASYRKKYAYHKHKSTFLGIR